MEYGTIRPDLRARRLVQGEHGPIDHFFNQMLASLDDSKQYEALRIEICLNPSNIGSLLLDIIDDAEASPDTELDTLVKLRSDWCPRCNGIGIIPRFMHVHDGMCFACLRTGRNAFKDMDIETARKEFEERQETYKGLFLAGVTDQSVRKVQSPIAVTKLPVRRSQVMRDAIAPSADYPEALIGPVTDALESEGKDPGLPPKLRTGLMPIRRSK